MIKKYPPTLNAILINAVLFGIFLACTNPIYDTNEDVTILYLLSGGFGAPPTELVHYNHILHPVLGICIKTLFSITGALNWYSVFLFVGHFIACSIILTQVLQKNRSWPAVLCYVLLFVVFEGRLLVAASFTYTSIVLGCAGLTLLYTATQDEKLHRGKVRAAILVLLAASLYRIHVLIPIAGIVLPYFYIQLKPRTSMAITLVLALVAGVIVLLNQLHQLYYKAQIAGWQQEERYRHQVFRFYNSHVLYQPQPGEQWYTEYHLVQNGLPIDTTFLTKNRLREMYADLSNKNRSRVAAANGDKWFWINNRLLLLCTLFLLFAWSLKRKFIIAVLLSFTCMTIGFMYLATTAKLPDYLYIASLFLTGIFVLISSTTTRLPNKYLSLAKMAFLFLLVGWGIMRIYKINRQTVLGISAFRKAYAEVARHPNTLFIVTGDAFPFQKFSAFDCPKNYLLSNLLMNEHFICNMQKPVFTRFHIAEPRQLPQSSSVLFWGKRVPALENYFQQVTGQPVAVSPPLQQFPSKQVYSITIKTP